MDFSGRVVLITGAASGMGAATTREFQAAGATVVMVDRNEEKVQQLAGELKLDAPLVGDVSNPDFCGETVAMTLSWHRRLDVLVNAAGIIVRADAGGTSNEQCQQGMNVNVNGVFFMSRAAIAPMKQQRSGAIVNFGSIWGDLGSTGVVAYCASKGAVHQITRAMALDHVRDGIRINAVCPGEVNRRSEHTDAGGGSQGAGDTRTAGPSGPECSAGAARRAGGSRARGPIPGL